MQDEDVPALCRSLRLPGLVDVHTHFMPVNVLDKVWAYFDRAGPLVGRPWPIAYRLAEDSRVATLRRLGVRAFPSLLYPHRPGMAEWLNAWASAFADRTADCLRSATFWPEPSAGRYVGEAVDAGTRIFKAHVQVGGWDPRDPLLDPVWAVLAESVTPVVVHCGSGPVPGAFTGPGPMSEVLARHPRLPLVVAHLGGPDYDEFLALAERRPNVRLDTTLVFTDFLEAADPFPPALLPRLADLGDRVLLGSDFPNIPHAYAHQIEVLARLGLGDDWLRRVLWGNGAELFGISGD